MHPVLFHHPWGQAHAYGTMILLGVLLSMVGARFDLRTRRLGDVPPGTLLLDLYLALAVGVLAGGRLLYVLTTPERYLHDPWRAFSPDPTGFVFFGSLLGMAASVWALARLRGVPAMALFDVVATWTPIPHATGRIGCFLAGCCYGAPTGVPWGVAMPAGSVAHRDARIPHAGAATVPLHPTQLYEAAILVVLAAYLAARRLRGVPPAGRQVARYAVLYGLARFGIEMLRGDADRRFLVEIPIPALARILDVPAAHPLFFSTSQCVSVALVFAGAWLWRRTG